MKATRAPPADRFSAQIPGSNTLGSFTIGPNGQPAPAGIEGIAAK